jgi:hypothetical protein
MMLRALKMVRGFGFLRHHGSTHLVESCLDFLKMKSASAGLRQGIRGDT